MVYEELIRILGNLLGKVVRQSSSAQVILY
jgi:hypothetical protein